MYHSKVYPLIELLRNRWLKQSAARYTLYVWGDTLACVELREGAPKMLASCPDGGQDVASVFELLPKPRTGRSRSLSGEGVALFLPGHYFLYQRLSLPAAIRDDLDDALDYQLEALFSLPAGHFVSDYQILKEADGQLELAVLSAEAGVINALEQAAAERGVRLQGIYPLLQSWTQLLGLDRPTLVVQETAGDAVAALADQGHLLAAARIADSESEARLVNAAGLAQPPERVTLGALDETVLLERHLQLQGPDFDFLSKAARGYWRRQRQLKLGLLGAVGAVALAFLLMLPGFTTLIQKQWLEYRLDRLEAEHGGLFEDWTLRSRMLGLEEVMDEVPAAHQLALLKEVALRLPKDSWLTYLRAEGNRVEIRGYAQQAANVITAFGESEVFSQVEFVRPVITAPNKSQEEFSIQMRLDAIDAEGFFERYVR